MSSKLKTYAILVAYCISLGIMISLYITIKKIYNPIIKNYSIMLQFMFASVFLLMVSSLLDLRSRPQNIKIKKIIHITAILSSCIALVVSVINTFNLINWQELNIIKEKYRAKYRHDFVIIVMFSSIFFWYHTNLKLNFYWFSAFKYWLKVYIYISFVLFLYLTLCLVFIGNNIPFPLFAQDN